MFNEMASAVVEEYNGYLNEKARFTNLRNAKQKEYDDMVMTDYDYNDLTLLEEYIEVYNGQINF